MLDAYRQWHSRRFRGRQSRLRLVSAATMVLFFGAIAGMLLFFVMFILVAKDLPRPDRVSRVEGLSTVILDRHGETVYDIFESQNRIPVKFEDMPLGLRQATIAVEDKDFYKHQGLSTSGILRAFLNIVTLRSFQGGSTLTQQLVKKALLSDERTILRKLKEAILATQIERKYTKDEILRMYLNEVPYGGTTAGVEAAAKYYFDKHAKDLTLPESVILAGLPQSPTAYSPFGKDPKAYIPRTQQVIRRMREDGYITPAQETELKKAITEIRFTGSGDESLKAPHFVAYVKEWLIEKFGQKALDTGGLRVTTTLDLKLQEKAQKITKEEVDKIKYLKATNGAAVVIDPKTGEILAMVGSKDYTATESAGYKFNVVTQGLRQPGSTMKPIVYSAALRKGYTAATLLMDVETKYPSGDPKKPDYNPKNYDLKYRGPMLLRYALGNSINTIAVKVLALVGIKDTLRQAYDMGLQTLEPTDENVKNFGLSLVLGGGDVRLLDITSAFGVFAAAGERREPVAVLKVEDVKGKTMYEYKLPAARRVLPADVAYVISHILSDNDARKDVFGERSLLVVPGHSVAVKTGTTDDKRDNWTIGYTPSAVVGVWVGNNDNTPMNPALASGITGAAPIWNRIIKEVLSGKPDEPFARPDTIIEMDIDGYGGGTPVPGGPVRKDIFIKGTEPNGPSPIYKTLKISKHESGKLANAVEIAKGEYEQKQYVVFSETDPVSGDGKNRWQEGIDAWVGGQSDQKFHPPREEYQGSDQLTVTISEPSDRSQVSGNDVRISAKAASLRTVRKMEIIVDGSVKKETQGTSISETVSMSSGSHTITVRATDEAGNGAAAVVKIGVNQPYADPTPQPTSSPVPTSAPTGAIPSPTP